MTYSGICFVLLLFGGVIEACDDINDRLCHVMSTTITHMCSDPCLAAQCRKTCRKCPLQCYECHEVIDPANCNNKVACPSTDHFCVATQSFTDDFREVYKLGCALKTLCQKNFHHVSILFGRSIKRTAAFDGDCCETDLCNNRKPSSFTPTSLPHNYKTTTAPAALTANSSCSDVPGVDCSSFLHSIPNMCSVDCLATKVCPKTCGRCVECYNCMHSADPANCRTTKVCKASQKCYLWSTLNPMTFKHEYNQGCMEPNTCDDMTSAFGRRRGAASLYLHCCSSDRCNHGSKVTLPTTTAPPTSKPTSHSTPTTPPHSTPPTSPPHSTPPTSPPHSTPPTSPSYSTPPTPPTHSTPPTSPPHSTPPTSPSYSTPPTPPTTSPPHSPTTTYSRPTSPPTSHPHSTPPTTTKPVTLTSVSPSVTVPCVDNDRQGLCTKYYPLICQRNGGPSTTFAVEQCAKSCNLCDLFQQYLAQGNIHINP